MGAFDDLIPQNGGSDPFADLTTGDKPGDKILRAGGFMASAKQSAGSLIKGAGQFAGDFIPGVTEDNALRRYGQEVIDANPTAVHSLADIADKPVTAAKEAVGNASASMAGIVGARLLGQGITAAAPLTGPAAPAVAAVGQGLSLLGPYAAAALPSFGSIRENQGTDTQEDKAVAALGAGTVGLIENKFGPQEWALSAMTKAGREQLAEKFAANTLTGSIAKGVGTGAAVEGAEELAQNPIEQLASYQDPRTPENVADTLFSGAMGAIGGGVVGGPLAGMAHRPQPVTVPRQDGTGSVTLDPANGVISSAAAEHISRTQTTEDLFGDLAPATPVASAIEPLLDVPESADPFGDLVPIEQGASTGPLQEFASQVEAMDLSDAQRLVQQSRDAGSDHLSVIEHPAGGGYIAAPREWLNAEQLHATQAFQPGALSGRIQNVLDAYDEAGHPDNGKIIRAALKSRAPTEQAVTFWEKQLERNRRTWQSIAGQGQPVEANLRNADDLWQGEREQTTRTFVPAEVTAAVLARSNILVQQLAERGVHLDEVDSRFPSEVTGIKAQESGLRGLFLRYARQLEAKAKGYKRFDPAALAKTEAELYKEIGFTVDQAPAATPRGWDGFQAGDQVTTKAGTTGTLHFDDTRTVAYVTPDKLAGGNTNPDAGKSMAKAMGVFSVSPGEVSKTTAPAKQSKLFSRMPAAIQATNLDREVYGLAAAGGSATSILNTIAEASSVPYRRELARLLLAKGIMPEVSVSQGDGEHAAAYDPHSNAVALFTDTDAERHFLHEIIHAATMEALGRQGMAAGQMKALHKHVVAQLGADSHYGLRSVDEFVAEAFTNERFQAELRRLPGAPGSSLASSWHWFVRTVRQLLGLDARHESALSQALQLGVSLMGEIPIQTAIDPSAHGAELKALRRAAARLERPDDGITFRVTDDGLAIATGPKGKIVPPRYADFARENGLKFEVRRLPVAAGTEAPAMPETYRESGAKYFGELASDARPIDRTGKTRFNMQRLAPNGKPSNLNEKQWHQVRTPAFKAWFGDWEKYPAKASKVVDENGEPLVVFHGTTKGGTFTEFKPNDRGLIWAASQRETAASYAGGEREVDMGKQERQRGVMAVFLNIRNPSEIKADGKSYVDLPQFDGEDFTDWFGQMAKTAGRDGAIIRNVIDDGGEGDKEIKTAGDNFVVFAATQVKSATQNAGTFDSSNPDVRFNIAEPEQLSAKDWISHQLANQRSWALGALTRDQLADIYGKQMPEVAEFDKVVQEMDQARNIIAERADEVIERWRRLPTKVADTLADVMHTATFEQFDPDLKTRDAVQTPEQSILVKDWESLTDEAKQLYRDVRDTYTATLLKLRNGLAKRAERAGRAGQRTAAEIRLQFDKYLAEGPYFPLARFGEFILIANNRMNERLVESFESSAAREKRARGLRILGWTTKLTAKKDYNAASDGPSGEFVGKVLKLVDGLEIEAKEKGALMDDLNQLAIGALPDQSYRRHFAHRKGTPGFSSDAMRAFASSMQHVAHHVARTLHGDELTLLLDSLNKRIRETTGDVDTTAQQQVANELAKRMELMMRPNTHPVTALAGQVGFVMSLGGSVASGITNLSQTPMITFPWLGAKFGFDKAAGALTKASKDYFGGRWDKWSGFVVKDNTKLSADERRALQQLEDLGLINLTQTSDLASTATTDSASSQRSWAINRAMKIVGWTFSVPEVFNRQVSALAAYRLAREKGEAHEQALETAGQTLRRTHFDYSASNRSRWMAGNFTRVVTMFKQYSQQMTYLLWRNAHQALKGESLEVRREARRMLLGVAAMHFSAAGALGLPLGVFGISPLLGLLSMGMGSDDDPWDWEVELRKMLADTFGKAGGEAIAHGPLRLLTNVDFASRVGLGDLWVRAPQGDNEGRDLVEKWMLTLLGPVAGYVGNLGTAAKAFDEGKYGRGLEAMLPKMVAAPLKAARYETEGVKSWRGDDLGVILSGGDVLGTALGFNPSKVAEMYEGRNAIKGREGRLVARREEIANMFVNAALAGDAEMQQEATKAAMVFSLRNPTMALTAQSLHQSLRAKVKAQALMKQGVYLPVKRQDLLAEGRFANLE